MVPVELQGSWVDGQVRPLRPCSRNGRRSFPRMACHHAGQVPIRGGRAQPVLSVRGLRCEFRQGPTDAVPAVNDVSFDVFAGQVLGIAGESGSGKSTLLRVIAGLVRPVAGEAGPRGRRLDPSAVPHARPKSGVRFRSCSKIPMPR